MFAYQLSKLLNTHIDCWIQNKSKNTPICLIQSVYKCKHYHYLYSLTIGLVYFIAGCAKTFLTLLTLKQYFWSTFTKTTISNVASVNQSFFFISGSHTISGSDYCLEVTPSFYHLPSLYQTKNSILTLVAKSYF